MSSAQKIIQAAAGNAGEALYVEDVFSTYLYTGTGSNRTVTNGIDLDGEGGLVWIKNRDRSSGTDHVLFDTERGTNKELHSNTTDAEDTSGSSLSAFNSNGFDIDGFDNNLNSNDSGADSYVSWTFRKAPKFFDVVTFTADAGSNNGTKAHAHNLGSSPGFIIIKQTNAANSWVTFHRSLAANNLMFLNATSDVSINSGYYSSVSDTHVTVGNALNENSAEYVMYLFAHNNNDGDFGETGDQDIIKCGSVTMNSSGNASITLGFEPSWVLLKRTDSASQWAILDTMRGWAFSGTAYLQPNNSNAEGNYGSTDVGEPTATGFEMKSWGANASYIYIAIRRGPMKTPESGTEVFDANAIVGNGTETVHTTGFTVDAHLSLRRSSNYPNLVDRMRGFYSGTNNNTKRLATHVTNAETSLTGSYYLGLDQNDGYKLGPLYENSGSTNYIQYSFRRAPGFFDVVAYEGNDTAGHEISHNLGVAPEMMIIKARDAALDWAVYHSGIGNTKYIWLNRTDAAGTASSYWDNTSPTDSVFTVGTTNKTNSNGTSYIAYLFASLPGISKVGSYTGNGTSQTIDCGFSPRFLLIKKAINGTGGWFVFDTERGIVAGNDPYLLLNTTDAENTGADTIDPVANGFIVNDNNTNANTDGYIFLAIA